MADFGMADFSCAALIIIAGCMEMSDGRLGMPARLAVQMGLISPAQLSSFLEAD
jgi:hypothetical protein